MWIRIQIIHLFLIPRLGPAFRLAKDQIRESKKMYLQIKKVYYQSEDPLWKQAEPITFCSFSTISWSLYLLNPKIQKPEIW